MTILLFGILSEYIDKDQVPWDSFQTIGDMEVFLRNQFPLLKDIPIQFAVNHQMASANFVVEDVKELALMPPFSGG
ncbi:MULTISPECIES: MoaD/ThiS family protein [Flavobacterium]|jgi:molybdopterin converting factor small subunit|uniref:MoaD/ThiS family protein n=1 Tax=Flavobacterium TaxID=237 RepID=UPI0003FCFD82|nr:MULTISPECIES: MoaD/ThiS family protein [Flavobacterium]